MEGSAQSRLGQWFTTGAFALPAPFTFGNAARTAPDARSHGIANYDFTIFKNTKVTERVGIQFRTEIFNLFNQLNLAHPDGSIDDGASFGRISATRASNNGDPSIGPGEPRNVQLALKIIW